MRKSQDSWIPDERLHTAEVVARRHPRRLGPGSGEGLPRPSRRQHSHAAIGAVCLLVLVVAFLPRPASGEVGAAARGEESPASRAAGNEGRQVDLAQSAAEVLAKHCFSCHSDANPKGGFSLQTHASLMAGGRQGNALVPADSDASRMIQMIEGFLEPMMPEDGLLPEEELGVLRRWIDAGAPSWRGNLARFDLEVPAVEPRHDLRPQIASLAFHPEGRLLGAGSLGEVRLLGIPGGEVQKTLPDLVNGVRAVDFSPDGSLLAVAGGPPGRYGELTLWEVKSGDLRATLEGHSDCIYAVAFSPDGKLLATSSYDRTIRLWDVAEERELSTLRDHIDAVFSIAFSPDGRWLGSASADGTVKIWETATGRRLYTLSEATEGLNAVAFQPHGRLLAAGGADKKIRIWSLGENQGQLVGSTFAHDGPILRLAFSPDGRTLASSGADRALKLWDVETLREVHVFEAQPDWVLALAISPDGGWLAAGRYDGSLELYEVKTHEGQSVQASKMDESKP